MGASAKDSFAILASQARELLDAATPQKHQFFFEPLGITAPARRAFVEGCLGLGEKRRAERRIRTQSIPRVIHRIWLTAEENPHFPPETFVQRIGRQMADVGDFCACMFWSNSEAVLKDVEARLAPSGPKPRIQFVSTAALSDDPVLARVGLAVRARKYVLAGDILKYLLLARFGGLYADLGVDFRQPLIDVVLAGEVSLYLSHDLFFQPAFMAAPPLSPPFQMFRHLLLRPEILAALCIDMSRQNSPEAEIWTHGGLGFSAALMLFFDRTYDVLPIVPTPGFLHVELLRSWYGEADSFGGVKVGEARPTHIDAAQCAALASGFEALRFGGAAGARLKVIAGLNNLYMVDSLEFSGRLKRRLSRFRIFGL